MICPYCSKEAELIVAAAFGPAVYRCPNDHVIAYDEHDQPIGRPVLKDASWFLGRSR